MSLQCQARVWRDEQSWVSHQCRYKAVTDRTVNRLADGTPRRIPVCRIHAKQSRHAFSEYRP